MLMHPLAIYLLAGISSVALAAAALLLATRTVQADAGSRPTPTPSAASPMTAPTPATLAAQSGSNGHNSLGLHGLASWYGGIFDGRKTASGERFDMYAMTACHPTLPFGSIVRVTNRKNHRSVVVRITDRGDLIDEGRVIDLSYGAAKKLAMVRSGLVPVDLEILSLGKAGMGQ